MAKTESELIFEEFCKSHGIPFDTIPVSASKTPDYNIYLCERKIVVEVKEINPNPAEKEKIRQFNSKGTITIKSDLGKRIHGKITDTTGKFKGETQSMTPSIVVLYNNVKLYKHTAPLDILAGMYGQLYFPISGNPGESLRIGELQSGPNKKMTVNTNTSISAIGVLEKCGMSNPKLTLYHNCHAKVRIDPSLLSPLGCKQYQVNDSDNPTDWIEFKQDCSV